MIPIEIINKILVYVGELNDSVIITQYYPITCKEYYIINFHSDFLWKIKSSLRMKQIYSIKNYNFSKDNIQLYKFGIEHYKKKLKEESNKLNLITN